MFFFYHFTSPYPKVQQEAASVYASIYSGYQLHSGNAHHLFQKEFKFFRLKPTKISYQRCSSWVTQIISGAFWKWKPSASDLMLRNPITN